MSIRVLVGWYTMIEDNVAFPFSMRMLGLDVEVERLDLDEADGSWWCVDREVSAAGADPRSPLA